jgi:hypothetical protein
MSPRKVLTGHRGSIPSAGNVQGELS